MMVQAADPVKRAVHATIRGALNRMGHPDEVQRDLAAAPDAVTRFLAKALEDTAVLIRRDYQRETVLTVGRFAIWWLDKDAAYRHFRNALLRYIASQGEHALIITPDVPPEEWWVNMWGEAELEGELSRATGSLPADATSLKEAAFFSRPTPGEE